MNFVTAQIIFLVYAILWSLANSLLVLPWLRKVTNDHVPIMIIADAAFLIIPSFILLGFLESMVLTGMTQG